MMTAQTEDGLTRSMMMDLMKHLQNVLSPATVEILFFSVQDYLVMVIIDLCNHIFLTTEIVSMVTLFRKTN